MLFNPFINNICGSDRNRLNSRKNVQYNKLLEEKETSQTGYSDVVLDPRLQ